MTEGTGIRPEAAAAARADRPGGSGPPSAAIEAAVRALGRRADDLTVETDGYVLRCCAGAVGCPRALVDVAALRDEAQRALDEAEIGPVLRGRVTGPLLLHHKLKVALAACPNACSEPQIRDFGAVGHRTPQATENECTQCGDCVTACHESAVRLLPEGPVIAPEACISCGDCARACPTGHLAHGAEGYALMVGGHLGRHPRLAVEVPGPFGQDEAIEALRRAVELFLHELNPGERFGALVARKGASAITGARSKSTALEG